VQDLGQYEFEKAIAKSLARNRVERNAHVLIGLSGGPDSVALLHGLLAMRDGGTVQKLTAAHLNHGLRGNESDGDEAFVHDLCERLGLDHVIERANGLGSNEGNLEERARLYRHGFLNAVAERCGAGYIALAHHADDQAETVLLRLLRGCGLTGAAAIAERGPGRLIRPLLGVRRAEVLGYLKAIDASYVIDSSNLRGLNVRSRVRNELIPLIEEIYSPRFTERLNEFADELRSASDFLTACASIELGRRRMADGRLDLDGFPSLHPALTAVMLREYLRERRGDLLGVNRVHIESMRRLCLDGPPNGLCTLPRGWRMRREYAQVMIEQAPFSKSAPFEVRLANGSYTIVEGSDFVFHLRALEASGLFLAAHPECLNGGSMVTLFDAETIGDYITVRSFRPGDRIYPLGMSGRRKIQDVFTDRKLPRERRHSWPLVVASNNEILWIPGMARARSALVTPATRKVLSVTAQQLTPDADAALPRI
jgi:tRNA(Ile)-lysidine synthase